MELLNNTIGQIESPVSPLAIYGIVALLIIIENGLIFGFFFPGDSLILAAGILSGVYFDIDIRIIVATVTFAAFVGSQIGYLIGNKFGKTLERNKNSPGIQSSVTRSQKFFAASPAFSVFASNFVPGLRIFVALIAGNRKMNKFTFLVANLFGSFTWGVTISLIGYKLAEIDWVHENAFLVVAGLFFASSGASIVNFFRTL
jgi:membrane-associated protein